MDGYVRPRLEDLNAPLVVVLLGSTGAGKSSLFNAIAGSALSQVGVLRPTTRKALVRKHREDKVPEALEQMREQGFLEIVPEPAERSGLLLVDAPDFDSVEADNRLLARRLLESADLVVFVTTDTRYADDVPWQILARAQERGVPMIVVINKLPLETSDREAVLADFDRLLVEGGVKALAAAGSLQVVGVAKGDLDPKLDGLDRSSVSQVTETLEQLSDDQAARREVAVTGLKRAVFGLVEPVSSLVAGLEREAAVRDRLLGKADEAYRRHYDEITDRIDRGTFLRSEVLREWHDFVGASRVSRVVSQGIGKVAAAIRAVFDPGPAAPTKEVKESAFQDLVALLVSQADEAAAEAASSWLVEPFGKDALERNPELWGAAPGLGEQFSTHLEHWADSISIRIRELGENLRGFAKVASLGVNVVGTGAILAVFIHTGGLTGAEAGIAAVTAVVNQTLLEAIFGEGNVSKFVDSARADLDSIIEGLLTEERQRFDQALAVSAHASRVAENLNAMLPVFKDPL